MQVNDIGGAGTFVQVIDILCHHCYIEALLKGCNKPVTVIGLNGEQFAATFVVEFKDKARVRSIALGMSRLS